MPVYEYRGINQKGKIVEGIVDADGPDSARLKLKTSGIYITDYLRLEEPKVSRKSDRFFDWLTTRERVPLKSISLMTYNLRALLQSGLSLTDALNVLIEQEGNHRLKKVLTYVKERVTEGESLSDALSEQGESFSPLYINVIKVGEETGTLEQALSQLSSHLDMQERIRGKVIQASAYPLLVALLGFLIVIFLLASVVPKVVSVFSETQVVLPLPTRILVALSSFMSRWWLLFAIIVAISIVLLQRFFGTERGRVFKESLIRKLPVLGRLYDLIINYRFSKMMETLLGSGVPLSTALDICARSIHHHETEEKLREANDEVREGGSLVDVFKDKGLFHGFVQMIGVGERSGRLEESFAMISRVYERSIETMTESLLALIEPVLIIIMGAVVGFIVISILLPVFEMSQIVG